MPVCSSAFALSSLIAPHPFPSTGQLLGVGGPVYMWLLGLTALALPVAYLTAITAGRHALSKHAHGLGLCYGVYPAIVCDSCQCADGYGNLRCVHTVCGDSARCRGLKSYAFCTS